MAIAIIIKNNLIAMPHFIIMAHFKNNLIVMAYFKNTVITNLSSLELNFSSMIISQLKLVVILYI